MRISDWSSDVCSSDLREVDEGLEAMDAWLMEYPQDLLVRTSLAETYMALGRLPAAEREYQAALEVAPDNAWTLNNLAWLRMSLGKAEEAEIGSASCRERVWQSV